MKVTRNDRIDTDWEPTDEIYSLDISFEELWMIKEALEQCIINEESSAYRKIMNDIEKIMNK